MHTVLVIDDNEGVRTALDVLLTLHDIAVIGADGPGSGMDILHSRPVDLVIQDMNFTRDTTSGDEGVALFHQLRAAKPDVPIILLTAWTHLETAVELVKAGAADYMAKPWDDTKLVTTARNLLRLHDATRVSRRLSAERRRAREDIGQKYDLCGTVYESEAMHQLISVAVKIAPADVSVLITGANGSGKEKLAEIIQANSGVRDGPFVRVNAGALPVELIESELFGAEAGAYTGAGKARAGRFEAADGGTLFLDEIGTLSLDGQAKLLRVLQTGEFERLGSNTTRKVNVRVISATNTDIREAVRSGRFREDLFFRLNVIELDMPPLADRTEDILPLARHFLGAGHTLDREAESTLLRYSWPGNVRELENTMQRAKLLARDKTIFALDLGLDELLAQDRGERVFRSEPDREEVESALGRAGGVVAKAARELGMSRQALYRRMEKFGIDKSG